MLNNLLDIVPGAGKNAGNYVFTDFGEALLYALVGFIIVFLGITVIIAIVWLVGFVMRKTNDLAFLKKKKAAPPAKELPEADEEDLPDEVKAAIIAAIMAYYSAEKPKCEFKVKRIKRI